MSFAPTKPVWREARSEPPPELLLPDQYRGQIVEDKTWEEIVAWVKDLPPLPKVAAQALVMVDDPDTSVNELVKLLFNDTALAAEVLKMANSSIFCCQREITTLKQAIMLIGLSSLKSIVVAATVKQLNKKNGKFEQMIWENSTCTAFGALAICKMLRKEYVEEIFLLGLLHDLGKLVLMKEIPEKYTEALKRTAEGFDSNTIEQVVLGYGHPLIGALVAKKWNFSEMICEVILHHHDPLPDDRSDKTMEVTAVIQAADLLAHKLGHAHLPGYPDQTLLADLALKKLGLSEEQIKLITEETERLFSEQAF